MIKIGILGAARIAPSAIIEPASRNDDAAIVAVAARDQVKAEAFASEHGIARAFGSYQALIDTEDIDLIYNALPPSQHKYWSLQALAAGKHVLCEKPFAMNAVEAQEMVEAARRSDRLLIEAFHYRFHPFFARVLELVRSGFIGEVRELRAHFDVAIPYSPGELRHELALGGGALMDLGCYPLHWVRSVMQSDPQVVSAQAQQGQPGIDISMAAVLAFPGDVSAQISCSMAENVERGSELSIVGEKGRIVAENPLAPHFGNRIVLEVGAQHKEGSVEESINGAAIQTTAKANADAPVHAPAYATTYDYQLAHVLRAIAGKVAPLTGGKDAVANMQLIDAIYCSAGMRPRG